MEEQIQEQQNVETEEVKTEEVNLTTVRGVERQLTINISIVIWQGLTVKYLLINRLTRLFEVRVLRRQDK